jgi:pyridinium-3,5-bisthiocarboxylic acid mononucleotide nickel chelatase
MTKIAYLDCPTGIAGDMCLGALVDLGVPLAYLTEQLGRLGISQEFKLWAEPVQRNGMRATKFHVELVFESGEIGDPDDFTTFDRSTGHRHAHTASIEPVAAITHAHEHPHEHPPHTRHLPEIEDLIIAAQLPPRAEDWSLAVFRKLAEAEGAVHGVPPEQVHFHEVGATDAIVDIVGTCLGLDWLGVDQVMCSAMPTGGGTIRAAHGRMPVPTPAVLKLFELRQVPIYSNGIQKELVTPTGAALATTLASDFGVSPSMTLHQVGLGAGTQELEIANILRLWIGEGKTDGRGQERAEGRGQLAEGIYQIGEYSSLAAHSSPATETIALLETQIDDLNPQAIAYVLESLLDIGALDVFTQAVGMKKSRLGTLLTVVCKPEDAMLCEAIIFRETTTLGIRRSLQERRAIPREIHQIETGYGKVRIKVAWAEGRDRSPTNIQPEYEDCAQIARQHNLPWREVHRAALQEWQLQ